MRKSLCATRQRNSFTRNIPWSWRRSLGGEKGRPVEFAIFQQWGCDELLACRDSRMLAQIEAYTNSPNTP